MLIYFLMRKELSNTSLFLQSNRPRFQPPSSGMSAVAHSSKKTVSLAGQVDFASWQLVFQPTNSTEQSPSWEGNSHWASQEIPRLLCNPRVQYRVHSSPPLVPILSQMHSVHTFPPYFLKIHCIIMYAVWIWIHLLCNALKWDVICRTDHQI